MKKSYYEIGNEFLASGAIEKAMENYYLSLRAGGPKDKIYNNLGVCHFKKEEYKMAILRFGEALREKETSERLKNLELAQNAFKKILSLSDTTERLKKIELAQNTFKKTLSVVDTTPIGYYSLESMIGKRTRKEKREAWAKEEKETTKRGEDDRPPLVKRNGRRYETRLMEKKENLFLCASCGGFYINPEEDPKQKKPLWKGWQNHCEFCKP
jgi:tetratricopeptide (TPR) repeat protein